MSKLRLSPQIQTVYSMLQYCNWNQYHSTVPSLHSRSTIDIELLDGDSVVVASVPEPLTLSDSNVRSQHLTTNPSSWSEEGSTAACRTWYCHYFYRHISLYSYGNVWANPMVRLSDCVVASKKQGFLCRASREKRSFAILACILLYWVARWTQ